MEGVAIYIFASIGIVAVAVFALIGIIAAFIR